MRKLIFLIFLFFSANYIFSQCVERGYVYLDPGDLNFTIKNINSINQLQKEFTLGVGCYGFQTAKINTQDNITTCTYDPKTISCYAVSNVMWLKIDNTSVSCNSPFKVKLDLNELKIEENKNSYSAQIKVVCSNGFSIAHDYINVNLNFDLNDFKMNVNPDYLYWSILKYDNSSDNMTYKSKEIHIKGVINGFDISYDDDYLEIKKDNSTGIFSGKLEVNLNYNLVKKLPVGIYYSYIKLKDKLSKKEEIIPVIIQVRDFDEPIIFPYIEKQGEDKPSSYFYTISDASPFFIDFILENYFEKNPSKNLYLILNLPDYKPDVYYLYVPYLSQIFIPISSPNIDYFTARGIIKHFSFGPFSIRGMKGRVFLQLKAGDNLSSAQTLQNVMISIINLEGKWKISDNYDNKIYPHPEILHIWKEGNGYKGCFFNGDKCKIPVLISYGNGKDILYQMSFYEDRFKFYYEILNIHDRFISGRWRWCYRESCSKYFTFSGYKEFSQ